MDVFIPVVLRSTARPQTGLSAVSSGLWASVMPEKHLQTGSALWYFSGSVFESKGKILLDFRGFLAVEGSDLLENFGTR